MTDAADLTARLIRCPSVTPEEGGALALLEGVLADAGFEVHRVDRNGTPNLFARWGAKGARTFGFNGHTDVVPAGDPAAWTHPPFSGLVEEGVIWGRGATDMKSGVAAFAAAAVDFVTATPPDGAIILAITGDEEGPAQDGTRALLDWMAEHDERMDVCIVGEPSNPDFMGEMMKIGRRGSVTFRIKATGLQGHAAYPHRARNPLHALTRFLDDLIASPLDEGTEHFDPSGLQITSIDCGNPASNVIPATATAVVNIRFNDLHSGASLTADLEKRAAAIEAETGVSLSISANISGESFLTKPGAFVDLVRDVVTQETGHQPELSTSGGTSDARFVKDHCPVVEFGLVGHFMHQVDERVPVAQVQQLQSIYRRILERFFA
ncbi:succinyldiaminopimelate desuccinylase [Paracoccus seriniphilus]|uniref:Succinyl-diaminopimelate desuccinylase n=2 Tax=Paracoccus seriniphilus TaxID=184748 RepID=A0A239PSD0_9RHOB|nr:succinyl-diaminopimelate desuccinylase [Paracoccus seriniphilus]WCR14330.1 succinyl-diaminopimelate desuccinylase [Paracoccus seriniphilus]SNT72963.1 succinyldiaminopimelate desuccinylase [Paracoccus seriniphilus]